MLLVVKVMDSVKKMVLVEPRVLEVLKEKKLEQSPLRNAMSSLDAEMNAIISRSDLTDADKVLLYDQVLQRYNVYREKLISAPNKVEVEKKKHFDESEILSNVPSSYKQKTKRLLHQIALEWLSWLEISNHIEIQHAFNKGEKVIGSRQIPVDGFCEETKTIYQFFGCYWHGHHCVLNKEKHGNMKTLNQWFSNFF